MSETGKLISVDLPQLVLPCPFCGGEQATPRQIKGHPMEVFAVHCRACGTDGPTGVSADRAVNHWNDAVARNAQKTLIGLCESAYSICMGDCEPSDMDDWITDFNEAKRKILGQNANMEAPPLRGDSATESKPLNQTQQ